jgi:integrase
MATIRRRGKKFEVQIRRTGQRRVSKSFNALSDARAWARHMEVQADRNGLPLDGKVLQRVTLGELVKRYRDTISLEKRDRISERYILAAFLRHPICAKQIAAIRTEDFTAYRDQRLQEIKPSSLKRQLAPIHNLFEIARDHWGLPILENPLARLQLKSADRRRERRLRPGEEERLIKAAARRRNLLMVPIIQLALETSMRRGEILGIRHEHVDIKGCALLIPETKNGYARTIPLTRRATAILRQRTKLADNRLFPISANALRLNWERLKRRANIDDLRFHDLRHEAISRLFEKGLTIPEVALISGHKDMRMLLRYAHPLRQQIIRKLGQRSRRAA